MLLLVVPMVRPLVVLFPRWPAVGHPVLEPGDLGIAELPRVPRPALPLRLFQRLSRRRTCRPGQTTISRL
jgi:hypothetical protein